MRGAKTARAAMTALYLAAAGPPAQAADAHILEANPSYRRNPDCAKIPAPTFRKMPISQGDSAICFAYSTADMISRRLGRIVSALDVATAFYFANPAELYKSRDARLRAYLEEHKDLPGEIAAERHRVDVSAEENPAKKPYFDKLEGGEEDAAALLLNVKGACLDRDLPSDDGYYNYLTDLAVMRRAAAVAPDPGICLRSVGATAPKLQDLVANSFNDAWVRFVDARCKRRLHGAAPLLPVSYRAAVDEREATERKREGQAIGPQEKAHMFAMIDYALDHRRNPTIGYSFYLLEARAPDDPDEFADHSSMVLARRKINGVCHYLVQDNTGEWCSRLRPAIAKRCIAGRIWLSEQELDETIYSVTYLR
jgi:hypothetical protein